MDEREQHQQDEAPKAGSNPASTHDPETEEDTASGGPADPPSGEA